MPLELLDAELLDDELAAAELDEAAELDDAAAEEELDAAATEELDTASPDEMDVLPPPVEPAEIADELDALGELFTAPPRPVADDPIVAAPPPCPPLVTPAAFELVAPAGCSTRSVP